MKLQPAYSIAIVCAFIKCALCAMPAWAGSPADTQPPPISDLARTLPPADLKAAEEFFRQGNYKEAAKILALDLKKDPRNPAIHYYLGRVLEKAGYDKEALAHLEWAVKWAPAGMIGHIAQKKSKELGQLRDIYESRTRAAGAETAQAAPNPMQPFFDWMDGVGQSVKTFVRQQKKAIAGSVTPYKAHYGHVMSMDDMHELVEKSRSVAVPQWSSNPDGVALFNGAPEPMPEWDYWRERFVRGFQLVLMRHIYNEASDHKHGAVACIYSLDRDGNLRGHIYASTADDTLNKCFIETVQEMNHSRLLMFPGKSRCPGYNFQMEWDFGPLLAYIHEYKAKQEAEAKLAMATAQAKILAAKKEKEKELAARAKLLEDSRVRKAEVSAMLLPKPKVEELKAVALKLSDMPITVKSQKTDAFEDISDKTIMSWPNLNR